jgi:hypothetical protein
MNTDMDLLELILFDVFISLIFVCFLITAVFFTGDSLFLILLSMAFGLVTIPFASTLGGWWTLLKMQERERMKYEIDKDKRFSGWICLDFGLKGNVRMFRVFSLVIAGVALYDLVRYFIG